MRWLYLRSQSTLGAVLFLLSGVVILDPNKAYADFREAIESARENADNLLAWMRKGGFWPEGLTMQQSADLVQAQRYLGYISESINRKEDSQ